LIHENTKRKNNIERLTKKYQMDELVELINNVVILNYEKNTATVKFTEKELKRLKEIKAALDNNINIEHSLDHLINSENAKKRSPYEIACEILSAFRKELIAARDLIQKEAKPELEIQEEIAKIDKALRDIAVHIPY
jgi:pentose-5-phosphate-3-epimerase